MLHRTKILSENISKLNLSKHFLRQHCRTKSTRRFNNAKDEDEDYHGVRRKTEIYLLKSRGQHLLMNPRVLNSIVQKSNILPTDTVLEIGPGTGNLTLKLLEVAEKVIAIEIDKRMVEILHKRVSERGLQDRLTVICQDALKTEFPEFDLLVANIPYGISSPLVAKLVFGKNPYRSGTLLLQKEFARRLLANPGDSEFNRLAVNVKLVADVEFVMNVSKKDFLPCPKVDSAVVKIHPKAEIPELDYQEWCAFTRTCFTKKNKTLGAIFKQKRMLLELMKLQEIKLDEVNNAIYSDYHVNDSEDEDGLHNEDNANVSSDVGMDLNLFREKVIDILRSGGFEDKRPSKLSHEELLNLLSLFNRARLHFHGQVKPTNGKDAELASAFGPL
ncbi:ribosomal RNA small subunit methyltransferase, mitochondrial-like [Nicotiana tabacum]|uniref:Ribosomal RNA small subunit methyltransferase, mitochondrial-like n=2 Tax=Nicotiana tabacum TaxID=4097 RepID=A0AC58U989_TOBAC|nr:PREDICTED: ribosomal RNA small subunit methyltransferase, mitochondrial-like [Nicotiana tabacum]